MQGRFNGNSQGDGSNLMAVTTVMVSIVSILPDGMLTSVVAASQTEKSDTSLS